MTQSQQSPLLLNLINLSRRARKAEDALALQFIVVNETFSLAPYVIGTLWVQREGVVSISGVSQVDRHSAFTLWLNRLCQGFYTAHASPSRIDTRALPADDQAEWAQSLPAYGLWIPGAKTEQEQAFGLLFARNEPWRDDEIAVINEWVDIWRHSWEKLHAPSVQGQIGEVWAAIRQGLQSPKTLFKGRSKRFWLITAAIVLFPIKLTVFAPAELVPANPAVIRVPIEGVVGEFFVTPNQRVDEGDLLFQLDLTSLQARLQIAQQETQIAAAELRQSTLQSLSDQKSRRMIAPQEGKAIERRFEAEYLKDLLGKAKITAPRAGVAIFDDPSEWIGRPVAAGERVMVVATEGEMEIEAWIPIGDAIELADASSVTLYLNAAPLSPVTGTLRYVGHEAQQRPDGSYAYRLRATVPKGESAQRIGLKGTARVSGQWVPFSYWVLRKPIAWLRQFLGI